MKRYNKKIICEIENINETKLKLINNLSWAF